MSAEVEAIRMEEDEPEMEETSNTTESRADEEMVPVEEELPTRPSSPPPDPTMAIADDERNWALALRDAVDVHEELHMISDMELAQFAIVTRGNTELAIQRIEAMQTFREHYKIDHINVAQGVSCLRAMMDQQPGFLLHVDSDPHKHESAIVIDVGVLDPHLTLALNKKGVENWDAFVKGIYYMKFCCQPNLATIRNGHCVLADFGEIDNKKFVPEVQQRLFHQVFQWFPFVPKHFMAYNTGYVATLKLALAKKLMPYHLRDTMLLGCRIEESDESQSPTRLLREFYLLPTLQMAQQALLNRALQMLSQRADNESCFRLN